MSSAAAAPPEADKADGSEAKSKAARRSSKKRGDKRGAAAGGHVEARPEDFVHIIPYKKPPPKKDGWQPVELSRTFKAAQLQLSGDALGATGAMILGTALDELERTGKSTALITLCIGAGMGTATIIERV